MAVFKSKKTYIKRYASNNIDKKLTFSNEVKSTFNTSAKLNVSALLKKEKPDTKTEKPKIDFSKLTSGVEVKPPKREAVSVAVKEAPKKAVVTKQADKAKEEKRLLIEKEKAEKAARLQKEKEEREALEAKKKSEKEALEKKEKEEKEALALLKTKKKEEESARKKAEKEKAVTEKENKKLEEKEKALKEKAEKRKIREEKAAIRREKYNKKFFAKLSVIVIILLGIGYFGYEVYKEEYAKYMALQEALSVSYAPEDYVYPEPAKEVADKNAAERERLFNEAMANAYIPARGEVPGLYKYDYVKSCYLTFDDGPSGAVTEQVLNTLKEHNVPATFFVVGKNAAEYPDQIKRMVSEGHSIGNHSYSHDYEYMYSGDPQFDEEMNRCKNTIDSILGSEYQNLLYRFPGGSFEVYKGFYIYNIMSEGYQYVDWNSLTGDAEKENPDKDYIMNALKESTANGTKEDIVVLLHDAGAKQITADTLSDVIKYLKSKNYVFKAITNSNYNPQ